MKKVSEYDQEIPHHTLQTNPDKTKICLGIDPALLVSKLWTLCIAITTWPATTDQTVLVNIPNDLHSMF